MERIGGIVFGALACFLTLLALDGPGDEWRFVANATQAYIVAVIAGGVADWFWPGLFRRLGSVRPRAR